MYTVENFKNGSGSLYSGIRDFLREAADKGFNEHFHSGRFEWMMAHPFLDVGMLSKIAAFRDENNRIVGAALFDTSFEDRWYLPHLDDDALLESMIRYVTDADIAPVTIKANLRDSSLCDLLDSMGFRKQYSEKVLELDLSGDLSYALPSGFRISTPDEKINDHQWRLVIHRGFDNNGEPEKMSGDAEKRLGDPRYIKVFAVTDSEYAAHCGVWYDGRDTAYIEPVATVPEHRRKGLGKAVVYEAALRAKERGAKRAIVLSDKEFYFRIGMKVSSEIGTWKKQLR